MQLPLQESDQEGNAVRTPKKRLSEVRDVENLTPVKKPCTDDKQTPMKGLKGRKGPDPSELKNRDGFGGRTVRASVCKNPDCSVERTRDFRNALCPDCEEGFRKRDARAESRWTPEMTKEVAKESAEKRCRRCFAEIFHFVRRPS